MKSILWLSALSGAVLVGGVCDAQDKIKRADVFGPDKVWNIHLRLTAKNYQAMQPTGKSDFGFGGPFGKKDDPKKKDAPKAKVDPDADIHKNKGFGIEFPWSVADLDFHGTLVENVGIRYKGNSTYQMSQQGLRRPLKIDINHYIENQKLHGMNGFALGNGAADPTRIRDALAFAVFRAAKVPASRTAFAKVSLTVDGKYDKTYVGVYTLIEPVDKPFLKQHFKSDKGMLLKPERIQGLMYLGEKWDAYKDRYNPKHEPTEEQKRRLIEFTKLVNMADDATFKKKIGDFLDVDGFLRFAAANSLISNLDSFFGLGHNYFLYLNPKTNRFHFIPWDLDLSFGSMNFGGGDSVEWAISTPYTGKNRLTERVLAMKEHNDAYRGHLKSLTAGAYSPKEMNALIAKLEGAIKDAVAKEPKTGGGFGFGFGKKQDLRDFVKKRSDSVIAQLEGKSEGKQLAGFGGFGGPGGGKGFGGFGLGNQLAKPILLATDSDKDGKISLAEFKTAAGKLFKEAGGDDARPVAEASLVETINKLMPAPKGFGGFNPPKGFGPGARITTALLKLGQAGDDKKLTQAQFLTGAEKLFKQWDKDKSGHLNEKKLVDGINELVPPAPFGGGFGGFGLGNALVKPIVDSTDTDKNGKLSLDEFKAAAGKLFKEAGGDERTPIAEDKLIETIDRLMPPPKGFGGFNPPPPPKGFGPGKRIAGAILKFSAAGETKKLTRDQFLSGAEKLFMQWDKDKNGTLDDREIVDGLNQFIPPPEFGPGFGPPPFGQPPADPKK